MLQLILIFLALFAWSAALVAAMAAMIRWIDYRLYEKERWNSNPFLYWLVTVLVVTSLATFIIGGMVAIIWFAVKWLGVS